MGALAAGSYLRTLREARQISRIDVARKHPITESQLYHIEERGRNSRAELVLLALIAVKGNVEHSKQLLLDETSTIEDGRNLALDWFNQQNYTAITSALNDNEHPLVKRVIEIIGELQGQPDKLAALAGYGERLIEESRHNNHR